MRRKIQNIFQAKPGRYNRSCPTLTIDTLCLCQYQMSSGSYSAIFPLSWSPKKTYETWWWLPKRHGKKICMVIFLPKICQESSRMLLAFYFFRFNDRYSYFRGFRHASRKHSHLQSGRIVYGNGRRECNYYLFLHLADYLQVYSSVEFYFLSVAIITPICLWMMFCYKLRHINNI